MRAGLNADVRRLSGVGFAVISGAAAAVAPLGALPSHRSSASTVARWYAGHAAAIRVEAVLASVALLLLVGWGAATVVAAGPHGMRLNTTLFAASATGFAVTFGLGGGALPAAASFHAATAPVAVTASLHDTAVAIVAMSGLFGAADRQRGGTLCRAGPTPRCFRGSVWRRFRRRARRACRAAYAEQTDQSVRRSDHTDRRRRVSRLGGSVCPSPAGSGKPRRRSIAPATKRALA